MDVMELKRQTMVRLKGIRKRMIKEYPFFGTLAMALTLGVSTVESAEEDNNSALKTAMTDMKHIVFNPLFAKRLSDEELLFVMMHEIGHCFLLHCIRGGGRERRLWNIACDIVVNSNILQSMGLEEFCVDGQPVMQKDIRGFRGADYTAEEMYERLQTQGAALWLHLGEETLVDNHQIWDDMEVSPSRMDELQRHLLKTAKGWAGKGAGVSTGIQNMLRAFEYKNQLRWKQILRAFVRYGSDGQEYNFRPPDRRFIDSPFIYPGLNEAEQEILKDLLFMVDKSGSIALKTLCSVMKEIEHALCTVKNLSGKLAFFDTQVSEPVTFKSRKDFEKFHVPHSSGGTDFHSIFQFVRERMKRHLPAGIIILTDGYAAFPEKSAAMGIPVLWIIVDSDRQPGWGRVVLLNTEMLTSQK